MNRKTFYDALRGSKAFPAGLSTPQVQGIEVILDVWGQWYEERFPYQFLAAALAEIHHETGARMVPVMETYASTPESAARILDKAYAKGQLPWVTKRYWLPDGDGRIWIGRGDLQITHKPNYATQEKIFREVYGVEVPLLQNPELALDPTISAVIAFEGMTKGMFRGSKLSDFWKGGKMDYKGQRKTVNGDSNDQVIATKMVQNGNAFERALREAGAAGGIGVSSPRYLPGMNGSTIKPSEMPAPKGGLTKGQEKVRELQERLIAHGFDVGTADGLFGKKTENGIDAFESARQIKLRHVDAATWEELLKPAAGEA